jgi:hypothetical protein
VEQEMTLEDYLIGPEINRHVVVVDGLRVECQNLGCNFVDYAPTSDDASVLKDIHENGS